MASLTLFLQNNRIIKINNLKELSILYYRAYNLYGLFYSDDHESEQLIYSSESLLQLIQFEREIEKAYLNGVKTLNLQ